MPELLGLSELKKRAKAAGYTKISRLADAGNTAPLDSWDGIPTDVESGSTHVDVSRHVERQHLVIVRKMG